VFSEKKCENSVGLRLKTAGLARKNNLGKEGVEKKNKEKRKTLKMLPINKNKENGATPLYIKAHREGQ